MIRRVVTFAVLLSVSLGAHDVITTPITFSREISRVVYGRCAGCHRDGGSAFSLTTYEQARPWAKAIKEEVLERRMPPWGAVKGFGQFRDDQGLTQEQIELIADWVEGGAPEGDPALLPKSPDFQEKHLTAPATAEITLRGGLAFKAPVTLEGIEPKNVVEGSSLMVTAVRPDGSIEPLLWLYNYRAQFARSYWYSAPLHLTAGARIEITPPEAGTIGLLVQQKK